MNYSWNYDIVLNNYSNNIVHGLCIGILVISVYLIESCSLIVWLVVLLIFMNTIVQNIRDTNNEWLSLLHGLNIVMIIMFIISAETLIFATVFVIAWNNLQVYDNILITADTTTITSTNTLLLWACGGTLWSVYTSELILTWTLEWIGTIMNGLAFCSNNVNEFSILAITFYNCAHTNIMYVLLGLHMNHVVIGICLLLVVQSISCIISTQSINTVQWLWNGGIILYWHFVDCLWIAILYTIYI